MVDPATTSDDERLLSHLRVATGAEQEVTLRKSLTQTLAGSYEILEVLGRGAGGVVFKAQDSRLGRLVAIKCIRPDAVTDGSASALREARLLTKVNHPGIASIYGVSESPGLPYIVMEFVDGVPLTEALASEPLSRQMETFASVLRAVAALHRAGVTHRDLKPANILVDRRGCVKLVDFGLARQPALYDLNRPQGTPTYVAPEQSLGRPANPSADVFSLGVILFELLTGQRPFSGQTEFELLNAIRRSDPPLPRSLRDSIPGNLQAICLSALEKDPSLRYPSAQEFLLDIDRMNRGEPVWANPTVVATALEHGIERHVSGIRRWQRDRMISPRECDYFLDKYERLRQRDEYWILDSRRISFLQVMLHLGVWSCVVSAFLMLAFPWPNAGLLRPLLPLGLLAALSAGGAMIWRRRAQRVAIVLLMGAAITSALADATIFQYFGILAHARDGGDLLGDLLTDRQLMAAASVWLAVSLFLWRWTKTAAFAVMSCISALAATTAAFALLGLRDQISQGNYASAAGRYLWPGLAAMLIATGLDLRVKRPAFASPFYIAGLSLLLASLTLIARFGPTLAWIGVVRFEDIPSSQIDYSFIINGLFYFAVAMVADRSTGSAWLRWIGNFLFWIAPSHVLLPILHLEDKWPLFSSTWTAAELILPAVSLALIFISVPKQMKSCFFSGFFYTAVSVQRLTSRHFQDRILWPIALAVVGLALAIVAHRKSGQNKVIGGASRGPSPGGR